MFNYNMMPDFTDLPLVSGQQTPDVQSSLNLGAEAFQKSLWNWLPGQREHGWMELSNLSLPHKDMEGLEKRVTPDIMDHQLEQSSRDAILAMVLKTNSQESGIPAFITSFPSAQLLNSLMHLFFRSEVLKTDSWIHLPTFCPRTQRPEFNGIVVAAGAILSSVPTGIYPFVIFLIHPAKSFSEKARICNPRNSSIRITYHCESVLHHEQEPNSHMNSLKKTIAELESYKSCKLML
jgi:hypothetical protein